jgi:hypothetical protein
MPLLGISAFQKLEQPDLCYTECWTKPINLFYINALQSLGPFPTLSAISVLFLNQ